MKHFYKMCTLHKVRRQFIYFYRIYENEYIIWSRWTLWKPMKPISYAIFTLLKSNKWCRLPFLWCRKCIFKHEPKFLVHYLKVVVAAELCKAGWSFKIIAFRIFILIKVLKFWTSILANTYLIDIFKVKPCKGKKF